MKRKNQKAFTLIELLIVIAIIAVLATVVILSLNPAELLRQARDSNRESDMATIKSAVALYLADVTSPTIGSSTVCYISIGSSTFYAPTSSSTPNWASESTCTPWFLTAASINASTSRNNDGTGWLPIDFSAISSGSPIGEEPVDPVNQAGNSGCDASSLSSCGLFYSYIMSGTTYKMGTFMESTKYATGTSDVENSDGGINAWVYEAGTNLTTL